MPRFRKKPVVIEAEQIRVNLLGPVPGFGWLSTNPFNACVMRRPNWWSKPVPMINTLEGWLTVSPGDWIVRGIAGEVYPVKEHIFAATYEPEEATT